MVTWDCAGHADSAGPAEAEGVALLAKVVVGSSARAVVFLVELFAAAVLGATLLCCYTRVFREHETLQPCDQGLIAVNLGLPKPTEARIRRRTFQGNREPQKFALPRYLQKCMAIWLCAELPQ